MKLLQGFRSLFNELRGKDANEKVLQACHNEAQSLMGKLRPYGEPEARNLRIGKRPHVNEQMLFDMWELYALSRVNDLLILRYQPGCDNAAGWKGPKVDMDEYFSFMTSLGLSVIQKNSFHGVYHEIVEVEQSPNDDEAITISDVLWPGFMLGNLIFSRSGIKVRGGTNFIRKEVAESSTLYWAFRRGNRPVSDPSHGWGSNSQWRTAFRRDYTTQNQIFYNVDGKLDASLPSEFLTPTERIELITNRCFVLTQKPHDDLWPFDDFYIETL